MAYRLGVELGRTHTVAVVVPDDDCPRPLALGADALAMPTALFVERKGAISCGPKAMDLATSEPDRLLRGIVERIGVPEPMTFGSGKHVGTHHAQDVAAAVVAWVLARAVEAQGARPAEMAVALPADLCEPRTTEPLRKALKAQGLGHVRLVQEYFAAGRLYTYAVAPSPGRPFATLHVGASGVRAAVLRGDLDGNVWPLGVPAARAGIGGDAFETAVLRRVLASMDMSTARAAAEPTEVAALRAACRWLREDLHSAESSDVALSVRGAPVRLKLTREQYDADVAGAVAAGIDLLDEVVLAAGVRRADLSAIMLCGAAAATPAVAVVLAERFAGVQLIRETDPALTVATGAALGLPDGADSDADLPGIPPHAAEQAQPKPKQATAPTPARPKRPAPAPVAPVPVEPFAEPAAIAAETAAYIGAVDAPEPIVEPVPNTPDSAVEPRPEPGETCPTALSAPKASAEATETEAAGEPVAEPAEAMAEVEDVAAHTAGQVEPVVEAVAEVGDIAEVGSDDAEPVAEPAAENVAGPVEAEPILEPTLEIEPVVEPALEVEVEAIAEAEVQAEDVEIEIEIEDAAVPENGAEDDANEEPAAEPEPAMESMEEPEPEWDEPAMEPAAEIEPDEELVAPVVLPAARTLRPARRDVPSRPMRQTPPQAPAAPAVRRPATAPALGSGRPIRPNESKTTPRRNQSELLGFDRGVRPARRHTEGALSVVPGRELGTVETLAGTPGPRRAVLPPPPVASALFVEVDGHPVDERTLGQRALSMLTPARVLTIGAITTAVYVGSNAWLHVH